jgi:hypothetical protein
MLSDRTPDRLENTTRGKVTVVYIVPVHKLSQVVFILLGQPERDGWYVHHTARLVFSQPSQLIRAGCSRTKLQQ